MIRRKGLITRASLLAVAATTAGAGNAYAQTAPAPAASAPVIQTTPITPNAIANTRFLFSGYIKLDAIETKADDGDFGDGGATGRDFYLPSATPVAALPGTGTNVPLSESAKLTMHAKQSRFIFGTDTDLADKSTVSSRLEVDLYGSTVGNQRATNTYGVQLRQAYLQYKGWLVGQAWTNFQDTGVLPETADYIGPTDGTVFVRQAQVRYTVGGFSISAENPETTITAPNGTQISSDDGALPDITAAYQFKFGGTGSYIRAAALVRQLKYDTPNATNGIKNEATSISASTTGEALSVSGKFVIGSNDDIRFMATIGEGMGRYLGLNFANDAVLTATTNNLTTGVNADLKAISGWAAFAAWRHAWTPQVRSTFMYALGSYSNKTQYTNANLINKKSDSIAANLFYSPIPKVDVGVELRVAKRTVENATTTADGTMKRLQASVKYSF